MLFISKLREITKTRMISQQVIEVILRCIKMRLTQFAPLTVLALTLFLICLTSDSEAYKWRPRSRRMCRRLDSTLVTQCTKGRRVGSYCRMSCRKGYRLLGRVKAGVFCLSNSRWNRRVARSRCVRIPPKIAVCPPLHKSLATNCTRGRRVGSTCALSCQPGYEMLSRLDLTRCLSIEKWRPSVRRVRCTKALCPEKRDCGFLSDNECQSACPKHQNLECAYDCDCMVVPFDKKTGEKVDVERNC